MKKLTKEQKLKDKAEEYKKAFEYELKINQGLRETVDSIKQENTMLKDLAYFNKSGYAEGGRKSWKEEYTKMKNRDNGVRDEMYTSNQVYLNIIDKLINPELVVKDRKDPMTGQIIL